LIARYCLKKLPGIYRGGGLDNGEFLKWFSLNYSLSEGVNELGVNDCSLPVKKIEEMKEKSAKVLVRDPAN
jgi:hypothetical protein